MNCLLVGESFDLRTGLPTVGRQAGSGQQGEKFPSDQKIVAYTDPLIRLICVSAICSCI
jgi:hypothetical protein